MNQLKQWGFSDEWWRGQKGEYWVLVQTVLSLGFILLPPYPVTLLIDVREKFEYQSGHIPSAINIPLRTLSQNLDQIPRDRPVILSCSTGYRSAIGVMTLHLFGYENVKGFPASFTGWKNAGEAIAKS
jgi:rhodanese-related sulfurtransferase